ncbi:MAG: SpoIIE family protein phosphatase, partial [Pseudonocardia sp.]|nr:SpoIIE family protein phosphatase [Pseudonocardia sp.]
MTAERGALGSSAGLVARAPWQRPPLGPSAGWAPELRAAAALMWESRHPMVIWWGADLTVLYNDAFAAAAGLTAGAGLGRPGRETFAEVWPTAGPALTGVLDSGEAVSVEEDHSPWTNGRGRAAGTSWTSSHSPIRDASGAVTGVFTTTGRAAGEHPDTEHPDTGYADDVVCRHAADGTWRSVSPSSTHTSGWRPGDLLGRHPLAFVHPEDHALTRAAFGGLRDGPVEVVLRFRCADGLYRWVEVRARAAARREILSVARDVTARVEAERELERFRTVAERTSDLVAIALADDRLWWVNAAGRELLGIGPDEDVRGVAMTRHIAPSMMARLRDEVLPTATVEGEWAGEMELTDRAGEIVPVWQVFITHRDHRGEVDFYSSVARDLRGQRAAEREREGAAAERGAREVADAAAARMRALVDGLSAVVWEADAATFEVTFVSERARVLLGYAPERWTTDPAFRWSIIHPDDREATVARCVERTAAGRDHDLSYRVRTADGRLRWLHDVVHVVRDERGEPVRMQGVLIDVTAQKRAEESASLLAEAGRLLSGPGELSAQLTALARLTTGPLGDCTVLALTDDDGRFRPVATAHVDPEREPLLARAAHAQAPEALRAAVQRGEPFVVPEITDDMDAEDGPSPEIADARARIGSRTAVVVPLTVGGEVLGLLAFATADATRHYDDVDLSFGRQVGERLAAALEARRLRERADLLQAATSELAAAAGTVGAAAAVGRAAQRGLGAAYVGLYRFGADHRLHSVLRHGYPDDVDLGAYSSLALDAGVPVTDAVRSGEPLWISSGEELERRYPDHAAVAVDLGTRALAVLPLRVAGAVTGALALSFDRPRVFRSADRAFAERLAGQAAQTFERTAVADERRLIAETLQRSLLPPEPPALARLSIARRYLPGAQHTQAGGDWYDVLDLDDGRVAIAVGDVVGQGAAAAAVMGQLRSALAAYLLDGDPPAEALRKLDRFSHRVPGSRASTAACLVLDTRDGAMRWARAGHLPPLVLGPGGPRYLDDSHGCVLGIPNAPPRTEGHAVIDPGSTVLLYTDGLVERRGETIDDGLARLASIAGAHADTAPDVLATAIIHAALDGRGPPDDVALIAARLRPPPLTARIPALAPELAALRARVREWAALAALGQELTDHVQLALGEAVTNAMEHAYAGRAPGVVEYRLELVRDGGVLVEVRDTGRWLPADGRRSASDAPRGGHGLAVIHGLAPGAVVDA